MPEGAYPPGRAARPEARNPVNDRRAAPAPAALAAFSADVEDYFQVEALRPHCPRERWETFSDRTEGNTDRLLEILDAASARGTFFILGWTAARHPDLVRRIAAAGHEIASHGYDHNQDSGCNPGNN